MGNESTNLDAVIYLPSYLFIKHNPRNNLETDALITQTNLATGETVTFKD